MMTHFLGSLDWVGKSLKHWLFVSCYLLLISNVLSLSISDVLSRWWFFKGGLPIGLSLKLLQELSLSVSPLVNVFQLSFCNSAKITSWHFSLSLFSCLLMPSCFVLCFTTDTWMLTRKWQMISWVVFEGVLWGAQKMILLFYMDDERDKMMRGFWAWQNAINIGS